MMNIGHFCAFGLIIMICECGLSAPQPPMIQNNHQSGSRVKREGTRDLAAIRQTVKREIGTMLNIDSRWDKYLNAAPEAVVTLARMVIIAVYNDDFLLHYVEPTSTKELRHSHIRPTLIQLVNTASRVFKQTSDEMKQIKTNLEKIPENVKRMVRFLAAGDESGFRDLANVAQSTTDTVKKCSQQASKIQDRVIALIELANEIDHRLAITEAELSQTLQYQATNDGHKALLNKNLSVVKKAIHEIGSLKRQLDMVQRFFQIVSAVLHVILQVSVRSLIDICRQLGYSPEVAKELLHAVRDRVLSDSSRVINTSELLKTIIEVYIRVSDQYILNPLKNFPKLKTSTKTQMEQILLRLARQSSVARSAIKDIAKAKRKSFKEGIKKSNNELRAILPVSDSSSEEDFGAKCVAGCR